MLMKLLTTSPMYEYMGKNMVLHYRSFHIRNMLYFVMNSGVGTRERPANLFILALPCRCRHASLGFTYIIFLAGHFTHTLFHTFLYKYNTCTLHSGQDLRIRNAYASIDDHHLSSIEVLFSNRMSLWPHTHVHWSAKNVNEIAHYLSYV